MNPPSHMVGSDCLADLARAACSRHSVHPRRAWQSTPYLMLFSMRVGSDCQADLARAAYSRHSAHPWRAWQSTPYLMLFVKARLAVDPLIPSCPES